MVTRVSKRGPPLYPKGRGPFPGKGVAMTRVSKRGPPLYPKGRGHFPGKGVALPGAAWPLTSPCRWRAILSTRGIPDGGPPPCGEGPCPPSAVAPPRAVRLKHPKDTGPQGLARPQGVAPPS